MKGGAYMKKAVIFLVLLMLMSFASVFADDLADVQSSGVLKFGIGPEYIPFIVLMKSAMKPGSMSR